MIETRNGQFTHRSRPMYLAVPMKTMPDRNLRSAHGQTHGLVRRSQFGAARTRTNAESLEQRQRVVVCWLMALLWLLFLMAGIILWNKASLGS
jgi:hypothetical protein